MSAPPLAGANAPLSSEVNSLIDLPSLQLQTMSPISSSWQIDPRLIAPDVWTERESLWLVDLVKAHGHAWDRFAAVEFQGRKTSKEIEEWYIFLAQLPDLLNSARAESNIKANNSASDDEDAAIAALEPQKKRARKKATEVIRKFKCRAPGCHRAYGTDIAVRLHMRKKHNMQYSAMPLVEPNDNTVTANVRAALLPTIPIATGSVDTRPELILEEALRRNQLAIEQVNQNLDNLEAQTFSYAVLGSNADNIVNQARGTLSTMPILMLPTTHASATLPAQSFISHMPITQVQGIPTQFGSNAMLAPTPTAAAANALQLPLFVSNPYIGPVPITTTSTTLSGSGPTQPASRRGRPARKRGGK